APAVEPPAAAEEDRRARREDADAEERRRGPPDPRAGVPRRQQAELLLGVGPDLGHQPPRLRLADAASPLPRHLPVGLRPPSPGAGARPRLAERPRVEPRRRRPPDRD